MRELNNILIIRFSSIGDILLTSPLVRLLRGAYPHARIDFLVKSEYTELVRWNPHLSSIIELKTSERDELTILKSKIRNERYDAIIDLHNNLRSRYLRFGSRAGIVRTVNKRIVRRFFLVNTKKNFYANVLPAADRYLETVKKFGIQDDRSGLELFFPEDVRSSVALSLNNYHLKKHNHVVGFVPTAKHFTKRWLPERFVEFGAKLAKKYGAKILIFGGKADIEYCDDIAHLINTQCSASVAESVAGKFSLLETAATFDHCDLVVTNDTGLMHIASARKRKIVAIFGSTVREFGFFPQGDNAVVVERNGLPCRPCSHIGLEKCPEGHFRCMKEIQADEVLTQADALLTRTT
jgi:heptosyltransferase-2